MRASIIALALALAPGPAFAEDAARRQPQTAEDKEDVERLHRAAIAALRDYANQYDFADERDYANYIGASLENIIALAATANRINGTPFDHAFSGLQHFAEFDLDKPQRERDLHRGQ